MRTRTQLRQRVQWRDERQSERGSGKQRDEASNGEEGFGLGTRHENAGSCTFRADGEVAQVEHREEHLVPGAHAEQEFLREETRAVTVHVLELVCKRLELLIK